MIGCLPSCENKPSAPLAQSVEHLPFKQGVRGSNPRRGTKKSLETQRFQGFSFFAHFLFVSNSVHKCLCVYVRIYVCGGGIIGVSEYFLQHFR